MKKGRLHLYYGRGKGKTCAGMGACLRAAGHGWRVGVAQFLKPGTSGELAILSRLDNVTVFPFYPDVKFTVNMTPSEIALAADFYTGLLHTIKTAAAELDLLLLDEVASALETGLIGENDFIRFLDSLPGNPEVIATAHTPPAFLLERADYITEMRQIRHPYEKGSPARKGVEW